LGFALKLNHTRNVLPRIGKALPREIELTPEEWKTRRRVTLTDIIDGNESTELFDRIGELERTVLHWRKECEAALTLAQENEQDAAKYRKHRRIIDAIEQG
jgi:hypothetical protein